MTDKSDDEDIEIIRLIPSVPPTFTSSPEEGKENTWKDLEIIDETIVQYLKHFNNEDYDEREVVLLQEILKDENGFSDTETTIELRIKPLKGEGKK